jgi:hypothetical protein
MFVRKKLAKKTLMKLKVRMYASEKLKAYLNVTFLTVEWEPAQLKITTESQFINSSKVQTVFITCRNNRKKAFTSGSGAELDQIKRNID